MDASFSAARKMKLWLLIAALALLFARFSSGEALTASATRASFAAGAVQFEYPSELLACELPRGRQLLLAISREEVPQSVAKLSDGFWIGVEVGRPEPGVSLRQQLVDGLRRDLPDATILPSADVGLAGWKGVRQAFTIARQQPLFAPPGASKRSTGERFAGWRQLVVTDWGRLEIHFVAPAPQLALRQEEMEHLLAGMTLRSPLLSTPEVAPQLRDAEPIVGVWKSSRGVFHLDGSGAVTLAYDRKKNFELTKQGLLDYDSPVRKLAGEFIAEDDVLRIRWADGSLLSMRWRVAGEELLITDHHGRTRRLSRVYR